MPDELCGNCLDDDGDGLVDAEDPACCGADLRFAGTLQHGLLKPRPDGTTKLRLRAVLGGSALTVDPPAEDVSLLVRVEPSPAPLCVRLAPGSFTARGRRFRYRGPKDTSGALRRVVIPVRADGTVRYKTLGPNMPLALDESASELPVRITVGFGAGAGGRCSSMSADFQRRGRAYKASGG